MFGATNRSSLVARLRRIALGGFWTRSMNATTTCPSPSTAMPNGPQELRARERLGLLPCPGNDGDEPAVAAERLRVADEDRAVPQEGDARWLGEQAALRESVRS